MNPTSSIACAGYGRAVFNRFGFRLKAELRTGALAIVCGVSAVVSQAASFNRDSLAVAESA
ncbi:MAG: hypothetical protein V4773_24475, partial [Verrucomicrobiota bacterium]